MSRQVKDDLDSDALRQWMRSAVKIVMPPPAYSTLRARAIEFHEKIERQLIEQGRLSQDALPRGRRFVHHKMVNYLRFGTMMSDGKFPRVVAEFAEGRDFLRVYGLLNESFLEQVADLYPDRKELRRACTEQSSSATVLMSPEDLYVPYLKEPSAS